jgi:O-antigen ligase
LIPQIINSLIFVYIAFLLTFKVIPLAAFGFLVLLGILVMLKDRITPFNIQEIKGFSYVTVGYFMIMFIATLFSDMKEASLSDLGRIIYFAFAPFLFISIYKSTLRKSYFINAIRLCLVLSGLTVLTQAYILHHSGRCSGLYNANTFGDLVAIITIVALSFVDITDKKSTLLSLFPVLMGIIGVIYSGSRGSLLVLVILFIIWIILKYYKSRYSLRIFFMTLLSILVFSTLVYRYSDTIHQRVDAAVNQTNAWKEGKDTSSSVAIRFEMYISGFKAFMNAPFLGYGFHNCTHAAARYASKDESTQERLNRWWHLHNELLSDGVNAGILGILGVLLLYFFPLIYFIKQGSDSYSQAGIIIVIGYVLIGLTHTQFGYEFETTFYLLMIGYLLIYTSRENKNA